jgi:amidase/aspartyl-tRNA(Asn)/glutamyl-tRNA(Gln) amidotransferase subunit A
MADDLCFLSATELAARIRARAVSPCEAVDASLDRIDAIDSDIKAFVTVLADAAKREAKIAEAELCRGHIRGPLHGVPIAIKDLFDFKAGVPNSFGSRVLKDYVPDHDASYVKRLEDAGAIVIGKTNVPEFGHKGVTDNFIVGPTSTPFRIGHNAGGSSGGSAAAVASGMVAAAQGSDGGGSVRIPAAWCGVYGFKPTYGAVAQVSRPNAFMSHTPFAQPGPLTRTVDDAALMLSVMIGADRRDPLCLPSFMQGLEQAPQRTARGLRIGYSRDFGGFPVSADVLAVVDASVEALEECGAEVCEVNLSLPADQRDLSELWLREVAISYASVVEGLKEEGLALLDHTDDLTPDFVDVLRRAYTMSMMDFQRDEVIRSRVFDMINDALVDVDLLVTPTVAVAPVANATDGSTVGPRSVNGIEVDPLIGWCLTYPVNFSGHPAASAPAGLTADGLPVGLQIIGRRFEDATILSASAALERARPWHAAYLELPVAIDRREPEGATPRLRARSEL